MTHFLIGEITINIEPKEDYKSGGVHDAAEFHCRVTGLKNGGREVSPPTKSIIPLRFFLKWLNETDYHENLFQL